MISYTTKIAQEFATNHKKTIFAISLQQCKYGKNGWYA